MQDILKKLSQNRLTVGLIAFLAVILISGGVFAQKFVAKNQAEVPIEEIALNFDPEGPYALLIPRKDGDAVNLIIKRISGYDSFSYQISYSDKEGTDRGAGDPNTWIKVEKGKNEFDQLILFGTCSQGYTSGGSHCVFDKGVENGNILLKIRKGNTAWVMKTDWHMQKPDVALGKISSADEHFLYSMTADREDLAVIAFSMTHDLTGAPKFPEGKINSGKVYTINLPLTKSFPKGDITMELSENPPAEAKIARYVDKDNKWLELDTKIDGSKLSAKSDGAGIFAVLIPSK